MRLPLTLGVLAVLVIAVFGSVLAETLHGMDACPMQSYDQKTGPTTMWYKLVTACDDHPAQEIYHNVRLQVFDWDDWEWDETFNPIFAESQYNVDWSAASRFREVEAFQGLLCYRIRSHHYVIEGDKGYYTDASTYSWGDCY